MDIHVFPFPIPPPTSLSTRSLWVFPVHQVRALVSCIQPGLVICFTQDNINYFLIVWIMFCSCNLNSSFYLSSLIFFPSKSYFNSISHLKKTSHHLLWFSHNSLTVAEWTQYGFLIQINRHFVYVLPDVRIPEREERRLPRQCNSQKGNLITDSSQGFLLQPTQWCRVRKKAPSPSCYINL